MRHVQMRPPEVSPVQGTTVPPSPPVMVPRAETVVGSAFTLKTGPPLSPWPAALVPACCSASTCSTLNQYDDMLDAVGLERRDVIPLTEGFVAITATRSET